MSSGGALWPLGSIFIDFGIDLGTLLGGLGLSLGSFLEALGLSWTFLGSLGPSRADMEWFSANFE